jgi:hypothetical protein
LLTREQDACDSSRILLQFMIILRISRNENKMTTIS